MSAAPKKVAVAVIGLGIIGSRAATRLAEHHDVLTWNRTPKGRGDEVATVEEATAAADIVLLYLKDSEAVREIAARIFALPPGKRTLVNHSTVDLETTHWLADECSKRGIDFLDCPFTGSRDAAAGGALVYYAGGPEEVVEHWEPLLLLTAKSVMRTGQAGTATVLKLATNLVSACTVQALSESLATATRHGVSAEMFIDAVSRNACGSPLAALKLPTMARGEFEPHFTLANMLKDSRYVLDLAAAVGVETPAIQAVSRRMADLCESGLADQDYSALAAPYRPA